LPRVEVVSLRTFIKMAPDPITAHEPSPVQKIINVFLGVLFANLADGLTVTIRSNVLQASYHSDQEGDENNFTQNWRATGRIDRSSMIADRRSRDSIASHHARSSLVQFDLVVHLLNKSALFF
jgi:hypothetical protein